MPDFPAAGPALDLVADIAAEVLALTPGGLRADAGSESFVGLGGSSLDATRLLSLCEERLGVSIDLAMLLSPAPLADVIAGAGEHASQPGAARPAGDSPADREPLPGQRQMLLAEIYGGAGIAMRLLASAELTGPLDVEALRDTLDWIVARHEALRTMFVRTGKITFARRVLPDCPPRLICQERPGTGTASDVAAVHEELGSDSGRLLRPLDAPPVIFVLTRLAEHRHLLSVLIHHMLADAWAAGLLWQEILERYQALAAGDEPSPAAPAPSPELVAARQAALAESGRLAALTATRVAQLRGVPAVIDLPTVLPRPPALDFRAARLPFTLTAAARDACDEMAATAKVTRTVVLLAAWALVVARQAGMTECVIGTAALQRPTADLMRAVACCAAPVPVHCVLPADQPVGDYLRAVARASAAAIAAADVPLDLLINGLGLPVDDQRLPLIQVMFSAYDDYLPSGLRAGDLEVTFHEGSCGGTSVDAALFVHSWGSSPGLLLEYTVSALTPGEAARLAASLDDVLRGFAGHLGSPLAG
ncbi:MAG TPA: condensation domain-containing protein [Streptosporangiaceae bacterium]